MGSNSHSGSTSKTLCIPAGHHSVYGCAGWTVPTLTSQLSKSQSRRSPFISLIRKRRTRNPCTSGQVLEPTNSQVANLSHGLRGADLGDHRITQISRGVAKYTLAEFTFGRTSGGPGCPALRLDSPSPRTFLGHGDRTACIPRCKARRCRSGSRTSRSPTPTSRTVFEVVPLAPQ